MLQSVILLTFCLTGISAMDFKVDFAKQPASIRFNPFYDKYELMLQLTISGGPASSSLTGVTVRTDKGMNSPDFNATVMVRVSSGGTGGRLVFLCSTLVRCLQMQKKIATSPAFIQQAVEFAPFGLQAGQPKEFNIVRSVEQPAAVPPILEDGKVVFQRHVDNNMSFARNWDSYANGFEDSHGNFWMGLEQLSALTKGRNCKLIYEGTSFNDSVLSATYRNFEVLGADENYRLRVGDAEPGRQLMNMEDANDSEFSTVDRDNDRSPMFCAKVYSSGWWFRDCHLHNPNGPIVPKANSTVTDQCFRFSSSFAITDWVCLKATKLSFRCS